MKAVLMERVGISLHMIYHYQRESKYAVDEIKFFVL